MKRIAVYVGLDYHQGSIQVCVLNKKGIVLCNRRCRNEVQEVLEVVQSFGSVAGVAVESCSGAACFVDSLVGVSGWRVELAHPGYVSRMKQNPDKSDYSDARMLADLIRVGYLPGVWLAPVFVRELRQLVRYRQQLVNEMRNRKLRIGALLRNERAGQGPSSRWSRRWWSWLRQEVELSVTGRWVMEEHMERLQELKKKIAQVEKRLRSSTATDVVVQKLMSFRGIGLITACILRAEVGRFDRFRNGKQLARFCGLSPRNASSGTRQADAGLVKAGNDLLRATLIETAHRLSWFAPRWQAFHARLRQAGKPSCVIAAAVANRWVRWLYHQMQPVAETV